MKKLLFGLFFLLAMVHSFAQNQIPNGCGSDQFWDILAQNDPLALERQADFDRQISDMVSIQGMNRTSGITATYTIPVVVHIIHNGGTENISDATVQQGIQDLNDAFANRGAYDSLVGVNTDIEFCLASQDPNGVGTTGIVRVQSPLTTFFLETQNNSLKALSIWDPTKYLNIWLVREINSTSMGSGVAGYATFPSSHGSPNDGIVNEARWFGSSTDNSKIHTHEAGHYLGLYHTFQGGCGNNDCLNDGDRVCDTPPDGSNAAVPCGASPNTCTTDADDLSANNPFRPVSSGGLGDQPDMFNNYMDYGYQGCQNAFTLGQKTRMTAAISGARSSLLASLGCLSPCANPIVASFTASATNVNAGTLVTFTSNGTGGTTFEWTRNGIPFGTGQNASWLSNAGGVFTITLTVDNGDPSCVQSFSLDITVTCSEHADFTASATSTNVGGTVNFTNTSTGGSTNFQWLVDGVVQGTSTQFSHTFPTAGGFFVQLVQTGPACADTSLAHYISVGNCQSNFANHWYFGSGAGLDFSSGQAVAVYNSAPAFQAGEAMAAASDSAGNLLFYTDGNNLFNRNHTVMPNGTNMRGGYSSAQGAMAIRKPGSNHLYYLFTQADFGNAITPDDGLYVSTIDMNLDGGLGDVIVHTDTLQRIATERLMAVSHCNGRDVWVINHEQDTDAFNAFLVTPNGIQAPVISNVGTVLTGGMNNSTALGLMKASPDGTKIAVTTTYVIPRVEIFDFDNSTGLLSNPNTIVSSSLPLPYGVEFSPNNQYLYVANSGNRTTIPANIWQFDVSLSTPALVTASMTKATGDYGTLGGLLLGPDGIIYVARFDQSWQETYLAKIANPNNQGMSCNFSYNGIFIAAQGTPGQYYSSIGLPVFSSSVYSTIVPEVSGPDSVCANSEGVVYNLGQSACNSGATLTFQVVGDAQVISSTDTTVTLSFGNSGNVILTVIATAACGEGATNLGITIVPSGPTTYLGPDIQLCQGSSTSLDAGTGFGTYTWSTGASTQTIQVNTAGIYWCEVTGGSECRPRDSVSVTVNSTPLTVNLGPNQTVCAGQIANLDAGPGYASYLWQDGSTNQVYSAWLAGNYAVTVTGAQCVGTATDQVDVIHSQAFSVNLGADTSICAGSSIVLNPGTSSGTYVWQDGSTGTTFSATQPGTYWVQVSNAQGCGSADTIEITNCVAINDFYAGLEAQIWPNPTSEEVNVWITVANIPRNANISFWDVWGRELQTVTPRIVGNQMEASFDLSGYAAGIYFMRFQTEKGTKTWKVERR